MLSRERGLFSITISQKYHTHESSELAPDAALPPFRAENRSISMNELRGVKFLKAHAAPPLVRPSLGPVRFSLPWQPSAAIHHAQNDASWPLRLGAAARPSVLASQAKKLWGHSLKLGCSAGPAPWKGLDEAPGGAGAAGRRSGSLVAGIDCRSTENKYRAKELCAFVLWAHQGGPCHGAASAALSGLLWRLLQRHPRIRAPWPRPEPARPP